MARITVVCDTADLTLEVDGILASIRSKPSWVQDRLRDELISMINDTSAVDVAIEDGQLHASLLSKVIDWAIRNDVTTA